MAGPLALIQRASHALKAAAMVWGQAGTYGWQQIRGDLWGVGAYWERGSSYQDALGQYTQQHPLYLNSAVMACVAWMQRTFPEPRLQVLTEADDEEIEGHPLVRLIKKPNPAYSRISLWQRTLFDWVPTGNAYWLKVGNRGGAVAELWHLPACRMRPERTSGSDYVSRYIYTVDGQEKVYAPEEIVHFRFGADPNNDMLGWSPLYAGQLEVATDNEGGEYRRSILTNMGLPGVVFSPKNPIPNEPGNVDYERAQAFKRVWQEATTGKNRGMPVIPSLPLDMHAPAATPKDMDLGSMTNVPEDRICALLGLSPLVVGLTSGAAHKTYANYSEAREAAMETNIVPTQACFAADLDIQLLPLFGDVDAQYIAFDYSTVRVLQEDENKLAERMGILVDKKIITTDEARAKLKFPPLTPEQKEELAPEPVPVPGQVPESMGDRAAQNGNGNGRRPPVGVKAAPGEPGSVEDEATKAAGVRFIPKGEVPPEFINAPEISEAEVDAAVRVWDQVMPEEFRGLLEAEPIEE